MSNVRSYVPFFRWLFVVPVGVAGVFLGLGSAVVLVVAVARLCPPELIVSGVCTASWYRAAESAAICIGAALGAFATVAFPSLIAPRHKVRVALAAFLAGAGYSAWFVASAGASAVLPFASALAAGAGATWLVVGRRENAT
jgi:hypothetical protein